MNLSRGVSKRRNLVISMRSAVHCTTVLLMLLCANCVWATAQTLQPEVIWAMPKSARIKCVTTQPGKMTVEYGTTPALGMTSTPEMRDWPDKNVTRHYVTLKGLQPNTQYYYRVRIALQGGGELVSDIRTFKTFRSFSRVLPTVRYSSYIIGSNWSLNDTNAPYHDWNAQHYDVNIAYAFDAAHIVKSYNPDAVCLRYDNITNSYVQLWSESARHWMSWADQQGISYERCALHYAVDTKVNLGSDPGERGFPVIASTWNYGVQRFDYNHYYLPNNVGWFLVIGHLLRFDIIYVSLDVPATGGYNGVWEYCNGVDAEGKPVSWAPLAVLEDTTEVRGTKFAQSGYIRFVPPKERTEWVRARYWIVNGFSDTTYRVFLVRFRVTQVASNQPRTVQNRQTCFQNEDFITRSTDNYWIVPGWDTSWETNPANNGDPEYNPNPPTSGGLGTAKSARFRWWSRLWYYRPDLMRFMTNVFDPYYREWYTGDWIRDMTSVPGVDGWYCDNYTTNTQPKPALDPTTTYTVEIGEFDTWTYFIQFADFLERTSIELTKLGKISSANNFVFLTPVDRWDISNATTNPDLVWAYFAPGIANREISMLFSHYYNGSQYSTLNTFFAEMALRADKGHYHVPIYAYSTATKAETNTQEWWFREKMRALAQYLLVKDADDEYLYLNAWHQNFYYGEYLTNPDSSLNRYYVAGIPKQKAYYIDAAMFNFGTPVTTVSPPHTQWVAYPNSWRPGVIPGLFVIHYTDQAPNYDSNGNFLGNNAKTWYFARRYTNALVVLRTGTTLSNVLDDRSMNEYTAFDLDGNYLRLRADGTLDPTPINRLNLRAQDAAILIPTDQPPPSNPSVQITVSTDRTNPKPLDVVTVTITARNNGGGEARNVRIQHNIPSEATYVLDSLKVNGTPVPDPADRTKIDVTIPSIPAGGQATVEFQMVIR